MLKAKLWLVSDCSVHTQGSAGILFSDQLFRYHFYFVALFYSTASEKETQRLNKNQTNRSRQDSVHTMLTTHCDIPSLASGLEFLMYAENLAKMSMPAVFDSGCRAPSLTYLASKRYIKSGWARSIVCAQLHIILRLLLASEVREAPRVGPTPICLLKFCRGGEKVHTWVGRGHPQGTPQSCWRPSWPRHWRLWRAGACPAPSSGGLRASWKRSKASSASTVARETFDSHTHTHAGSRGDQQPAAFIVTDKWTGQKMHYCGLATQLHWRGYSPYPSCSCWAPLCGRRRAATYLCVPSTRQPSNQHILYQMSLAGRWHQHTQARDEQLALHERSAQVSSRRHEQLFLTGEDVIFHLCAQLTGWRHSRLDVNVNI